MSESFARLSPAVSMGIEEEFLLIDRELMLPATPTVHQSNALQDIRPGQGATSQEWLSCQVEHASAVLQDAPAATTALLRFRQNLASVAEGFGLIAAPIGTAPTIAEFGAAVSNDPRYRQMTDLAPGIAADQYINGMHVHVSVPDPETGIRALNGIRRWLPLLTALGANSPFWRGLDSGFASWRSIHYRRWMVNGVPPAFRDFTDYENRIDALVNSDVVADRGGISWLARLSQLHPTIEIRACDVQLQVLDAVVLATLIRALVCAAIDQPSRVQPEPELLDVAHWQAAKFGLSSRLLDPFTGAPVLADVVVWQAFNQAWPYLVEFGDEELVRSGLELFLAQGTGATRQRKMAQLSGLTGVINHSGGAIADTERPPLASSHRPDPVRY
ncbi:MULTISPECIES: carboxylate-amine ligase [Nesterenkonia]|uniref:Putative glutamate--cysteine ligase 2 n=1 Tax=Nesterenkonia aurantiaca TaxID=1436010 RepID=A0A4R7G669_9MICC|nr:MULTISPECIES: YbdK family carboxylate-amine ligase [Nesterenkonia]TDS86929.1 carboxylate-amine ligase [Nesterenkonia aurantiaca]